MCEDRERLIGYIYDACEPGERRLIETHLAECATCRQEVRDLRGVRQDLLAWEVPSPPPVWRPVAPVRPVWQTMPAWAMAAAAAVVLAVGAAGGAATHAWWPEAPAAVVETRAALAPVAARPADQPALAALEARVRELEKSNTDLVRVLAARPVASPEAFQATASTSQLAQQIRQLAERQDELSRTVMTMGLETVGLKNRQVGLQQLVSLSLDSNARER